MNIRLFEFSACSSMVLTFMHKFCICRYFRFTVQNNGSKVLLMSLMNVNTTYTVWTVNDVNERAWINSRRHWRSTLYEKSERIWQQFRRLLKTYLMILCENTKFQLAFLLFNDLCGFYVLSSTCNQNGVTKKIENSP